MFADTLKRLREKAGISQQKLANIVGLTQQAIAKWEKNKAEPDTETLIKLAKYFDVTVDQLLGQTTSDNLETPGFNKMHYGTINFSPPPAKNETALTPKDRKELERSAEHIKNVMMSVTGLAFNNKPQDDETYEKVMAALEEAMILARKEAQKKYTPKKYRKDEKHP